MEEIENGNISYDHDRFETAMGHKISE